MSTAKRRAARQVHIDREKREALAVSALAAMEEIEAVLALDNVFNEHADIRDIVARWREGQK